MNGARLIPGVYVFAGNARVKVKPKFVALLGSVAPLFKVTGFRDDASGTLMRAELAQVLQEWWPRCAGVAGALPVRVVGDLDPADRVLGALKDALLDARINDVPVTVQFLSTSSKPEEIAAWSDLIYRAEKWGRLDGARAFILYQQFGGISLRARTAPVLAFLAALFGLTWSREDGQGFHCEWMRGFAVCAAAIQSFAAPCLRSIAEALVERAILAELSPRFSNRVVREIREQTIRCPPVDRLAVSPVRATLASAERQIYLNERLGQLLVRSAEFSFSLGQMRDQLDAVSKLASSTTVCEAIEDVVLEIQRVQASLADHPLQPTTPRHALEEMITDLPDLSSETASAIDSIFHVCAVPVALYFDDVTGTVLQSALFGAKESAVAAVSENLRDRFRSRVFETHYRWLRPTLITDKKAAVVSAALKSQHSVETVRCFEHVAHELQRDFYDEIIALPDTICFSQFLTLGSLVT